MLSAETEQWLREGYLRRMNTVAVRRDLGPILSHGEPETGMGQGDAADTPTSTEADTRRPAPRPQRRPRCRPRRRRTPRRVSWWPVDFASLGPDGNPGPAAA